MNTKRYIDDFVVWNESGDEKLPDVSFVPAMIRRRMSDLEKIAVGLAGKIAPTDTNYTVVFASKFGEWGQTVHLIKQFFNDGEMSPSGFSNSVHNAAPGQFSLITKNTNSYTAIAAGDDTLEMAILKAISENTNVMVIFAGEHSPEIYTPILKTEQDAFGMAFMIKPDGNRAIKITSGTPDAPTLTFDMMADFLSGRIKSITTKNWTMQDD